MMENEKKVKKNDLIEGIVCDVKNCVYNDGDNCCMAGKIEVGPSYATSSSDTVCATFKQDK